MAGNTGANSILRGRRKGDGTSSDNGEAVAQG
jgi:hypothetical protein